MSDDVDVEGSFSKEEYNEKNSQVTKEIECTYLQKRGKSGIGSRRLVSTTFTNILLTPKGPKGTPNSPNCQ
jgi:hypothetical protein